MIPAIEKEIFIKIGYTDKFLNIKKRYLNKGIDVPLFKKDVVKRQLNELGLEYSNKNNSYSFRRVHEHHKFVFYFLIRRNIIDMYINIYVNDKILDERVSNMGSILRYMPFDQGMADAINEVGFNINDENELRLYIHDMYCLYSEFVNEYIKEIEAGNVVVEAK